MNGFLRRRPPRALDALRRLSGLAHCGAFLARHSELAQANGLMAFVVPSGIEARRTPPLGAGLLRRAPSACFIRDRPLERREHIGDAANGFEVMQGDVVAS
jgi:hypothetical protein